LFYCVDGGDGLWVWVFLLVGFRVFFVIGVWVFFVGSFLLFGVCAFALEAFEESLGEAYACFGLGVGGDGGEEAEVGVELDLVEGGDLSIFPGVAAVVVASVFAGEGSGGDLEAEEEEAGAFGVEVIGGDAGEDLGDGELDGGAVFQYGEGEGFEVGVRVAGDADLGDEAAAGVVVEAEVLAAQGGRAAAVAGGVDVAALHAGFDVGFELGFHVVPPGDVFL
jgi:hypothetical protein